MARTRSQRSGFEQRLLRTLRDAGVQFGWKLAIGFSGGTDSLSLAAGLVRVAPVLGVQLSLIHVDHQLRVGSAIDAESCRTLADSLNLPIDVRTLDAGLPTRAVGIGIEEAARRERYLALEAACLAWDADALVLAHQANDQAETVLLHLLRGSGLDGLCGMQVREVRNVPWWDSSPGDSHERVIIRPMLHETRSSVQRYLKSTGLSPVEDPSNDAIDFDRNWIRHTVLPPINERWPAAIETIGRATNSLQLDKMHLEEEAADLYGKSVSTSLALRRELLADASPALVHRVIRSWLLQLGCNEVTWNVVARIDDLVRSGNESRVVEAGSGRTIVLAGDLLITIQALELDYRARVPIASNGELPAWEVSLSEPGEEADAFVDAPEGRDLDLRALRRGDRWWGTTRSVFEDLRDAGIHPLMRDKLLAVAVQGDILLIPAIYPTMYATAILGPTRKTGVRWRKRT